MIDFKARIEEMCNTETARKLEGILRRIAEPQIKNPDEYVFCGLSDLPDEEDQKLLIGYIEKYGITHPSDVIEIVMCIEEGSEPELKE